LYWGPAEVTFDGVDLGELGEVTAELDLPRDVQMADKYGDTPLKMYTKGATAVVRVQCKAWTRTVLDAAFPGATIDSAGDEISADGEFHDVTSEAKALVVTPTQSSHSSKVLTIPLAVAGEAITVSYTKDTEQIFEIAFTALYSTADSYVWKLGDAAL